MEVETGQSSVEFELSSGLYISHSSRMPLTSIVMGEHTQSCPWRPPRLPEPRDLTRWKAQPTIATSVLCTNSQSLIAFSFKDTEEPAYL